MSENVLEVKVNGHRPAPVRERAPRSANKINEMYCHTLGLTDGDVWHLKQRAGRSAVASSMITKALRAGEGTVAGSGVHVDRYLADAVLRWVVARCQTTASKRTYVDSMRRWLAWESRGHHSRTLEAQITVTAARVNEWLRSMEEIDHLSVRTIVRHRAVIQGWFRWLMEMDLIQRIPLNQESFRGWRVRHERVERGDGTRQALKPDEAQRLANWALTIATPRIGFAALLQTVSGLRSCEVAGALRRQLSVAEEVGRLVVEGKGGRQRIVTLEPVVLASWKRYQAANRLSGDRGHLINHKSKPFDVHTIQRWAKQGLIAAGRGDLSSHDLRRTATTLLVENGATLEQAKRFLGHSSIQVTERCYVARSPRMDATTGITAPTPVVPSLVKVLTATEQPEAESGQPQTASILILDPAASAPRVEPLMDAASAWPDSLEQ